MTDSTLDKDTNRDSGIVEQETANILEKPVVNILNETRYGKYSNILCVTKYSIMLRVTKYSIIVLLNKVFE